MISVELPECDGGGDPSLSDDGEWCDLLDDPSAGGDQSSDDLGDQFPWDDLGGDFWELEFCGGDFWELELLSPPLFWEEGDFWELEFCGGDFWELEFLSPPLF